jgi:hypothetical protein
MENSRNKICLKRNNFFEFEKLVERLADELYIVDSYFSILNVANEQFYHWVFDTYETKSAALSIDIIDNCIVVNWFFDREIFDLLKRDFTIDKNPVVDIIMHLVDNFIFTDDSGNIQFHFNFANGFEKVCASRASVLSAYYNKVRVAVNVHHDIF